jgi:xanthine dehydrogenase YagT iron-sulfur-binding subunit
MEEDPKKGSTCECGRFKDSNSRDSDEVQERGVTRRGFIASMAAGSAAVVVAGARSHADETGNISDNEEMIKISLRINGQDYKLLVEPRWNLLFLLREKLGLTGTKIGCERGECGACTVLMDGKPKYACMILAVEAEGQEITTLEGLMNGERLGPTQEAFAENDAFQCGYCTPGQIMAVEGLIRQNPDPDMDEIRRGVSGNLCRCGAYHNIFKAAKRAAELKSGKGGS